MLTVKQVKLYKAFSKNKEKFKNEIDFQELSPYSFLVRNKVHILRYSREGIEAYAVENFNPNENYRSLRPLMDKEGQRLYPSGL